MPDVAVHVCGTLWNANDVLLVLLLGFPWSLFIMLCGPNSCCITMFDVLASIMRFMHRCFMRISDLVRLRVQEAVTRDTVYRNRYRRGGAAVPAAPRWYACVLRERWMAREW